MSNKNYQRRRFAGRLMSLPLSGSANPFGPAGQPAFLLKGAASQGDTPDSVVVINFPAMPDSVELARGTNYTVSSMYTAPDGFHQYFATEPLRIPFSFRLHAQDEEFCSQGGLTILEVAARLHALQLPIRDTSGWAYDYIANSAPPADGSPSRYEPTVSITPAQRESLVSNKLSVLPPVAVVLDLIQTTEDGPGIRCNGYVSEVAVKLNGPFLQPPANIGGYNIPTSGDFSFVFVHRPTHSNDFTNVANVHAMANDVRNRLYNTRNMAYAPGTGGYVTRGFPGS